MDLRHLRYFLCVAQEMHFGRAALRLGISQPPLSQQIRALEEELGVRLFDRTSRRVRLTQAGRLFEPEARQTLAQADRAAQIARMAGRAEIGQLGLALTTSGPFVPPVARALYRFRQTHPGVELTLREQGRDEQVESVRARQLDVGILRDYEAPVLPDGMVSHCLLREEMLLALRSDHWLARRDAPPGISDLREEPLVLYGGSSGAGFTDHFLALCTGAGFMPKIAHETRSLATLLGLVAAGFGPTILARSMARLHVDNVINRAFDTPVMSALWLVHHVDLSPTGQAFVDMLMEERDATHPLPISRSSDYARG